MCVHACACRVHCRCSLPPHSDTTSALYVPLLFTLPPPPRIVFSSPPCPMLPLVLFRIHPFRPHWRFTSLLRLTPFRLASSRLASSSFSLSAIISLPRGALARGATSDALCCRRVVTAAASIPRLSRFRLSCRRGSRGDSHLSCKSHSG